MTNTMVKQRLALGNLLPKIRDAYRAEEIDDETVRHLTLASPGQQKKWLRLFADPKEYAPRGVQLKQWLFGGQEISTKAALFPLTDYTGQTVTDLFGEESYFADADLFWALQNRAIAAKREALLKAGWSEVNVLEIGQHFATWEHEKTPKKKGGKVFITVSHDGEVEVFDGWLSQKEARRLAKVKDSEKKGGKPISADASVKPAMTKAMENYLELHRQAAVRLAVIANPSIAFRLAVAHMVASSGNWTVKADPQQTRSNAIRDSIAKGRAQAAFEAEHDAVFAMLALTDSDDDLGGLRGNDTKTVAVFARLLTLTDADVQRIAAFVIAETLAVGSVVVEAVGDHLKVDSAAHWRPDDTFFDLIRDRVTLNAMLADAAGEEVANGNVAEKAKTQKQIIRDCLTGANGRVKVDNWLPGWMAFPFRGYGNGACGPAQAAEAARDILR
jgi:ParB family chromosome partitioning protein